MNRHWARRPAVAVVLSLAVSLVAVGASPAAAADDAVIDAAAAYLAAQQQGNGGFDVSGFPGFETPDAVLGLAEAAQADLDWSATEATVGVEAVTTNGLSGFDALDDLVDVGIDAGQAAKLIVLDVTPLGLDPNAFDLSADSVPDPDLVAIMDAGRLPDGSYGNFNATLFVLLAHYVLARPIPADTVALVAGAQQDNGSWNFAGDPFGVDEDVDTTGYAVQGLVAAGYDAFDLEVASAIGFLARAHNPDGSWSAFGLPDPNSTALAILAITAAGFDVNSPAWRDRFEPSLAGTPYVSPDDYLLSLAQPDGSIALDTTFSKVFSTSQAVEALSRLWLPVATAAAPDSTAGYTLVGRDAGVFAFGDDFFLGAGGSLEVVGGANQPSGLGYWLFDRSGDTLAFGTALDFGSVDSNAPIVGGSPIPDGNGFRLAASDGGVFSFGSASFFGSLAGVALNEPIVGIATDPNDERNHWLVAADGGVFNLGLANFFGSTGGITLNQPVVGMAPTPDGNGYWLVAADGGVFAFGSAQYFGSTGDIALNQPVVGITPAPDGNGYWLAAADGGVFAFGSAQFEGSMGGLSLNAPIVAIF